MGDQEQSDQRQPMWTPYGFVPYGMQPQNAEGQLQEQMPMQMAMMNPMMSPMMNPMMAGMMRGSGYGQVQFPPQMMMPQMPNQLQLAHHDDIDDIDAEDIAANYPTGAWNQQGMPPMIYPMMMMMPYNQPQASQYPDVVEDGAQEEFIDAVSDFPEDNLRQFDANVTPDLVRVATDNEPTYMNEQQIAELPSYANENILLAPQELEAPNHPPVSQQQQQQHRKPQARPIRAQSVQPTNRAGPVYQNDEDGKGQTYQGKKYNTYRSPRSGQSQSVLRSYPLAKSLSTASHIHAVSELNRPPTVLHIPDIKPRIRRGSGGSLGPTTSLLPSSVNTNLKEIGSKLGKSLLNLKNILSGSSFNLAEPQSTPQFKPRPKDTPIVPRRPPRRKSSFCSRPNTKSTEGEKDHQFTQDDIIREVDTPVESPTFPREPKVPMPGESVPTSPSTRKPSVPMPGIPRIPSPTSTINTLELIGSPTSSRPRVRQPSGTLSPILKPKQTPKYENTETPDPAVPMPGTPSQSVKLRQAPGRKAPTVPQPQGSNKMRRSNRFSGASLNNSTTPFHSTTSTGFFSLEDTDLENKTPVSPNLSLNSGGNNTFQNSLSAAPQAVFLQEGRESSLSSSSQLPDMPSSIERSSTFGDIAALEESNRVVMERLKRNELPTPSNDYDESTKEDTKRMNLLQTVDRPEPSITPLSNVTDENMMTETRDDLLQGIRDMDDSIQTLKAEMSKLMSVYEYVKFKPEETVKIEAAPDITIDQCDTESINITPIEDQNLKGNRSEVSEKPVTPMITEMGQTVLEVVGDEAVIKFKNYGGIPVEEAISRANITIGTKQLEVDESVHESDYNVELGVYHENEMSGQPTLSPKPFKKSFKNKRKQNNKTFRKSFLGIPQQDSIELSSDAKESEKETEEDPYEDLGSMISETDSSAPSHDGSDVNNKFGVANDYSNVQKSDSGLKDHSEAWENNSETPDVTIEIVDSTATLDATTDDEGGANLTIDDFLGETETIANDINDEEDEIFNNLITRSSRQTWEDMEGLGDSNIPPPLLLQENLRSLKLDLLSSIFQGLYPTEGDCEMVKHFISCPASLEEKYSMMRLADLLKRNKKVGVSLETLAAAMSQLARIGQELMKPELERDPIWRTIPCAKEILVQKGIANRAPWEMIQGGSEILESLGYTEYTGYALQYPRNIIPDMFADHIGNLTVELVLASAEVTTLVRRRQPSLRTLNILLEVQPFPGMEPENYYPDVPMLEDPSHRANSSMNSWIKKPSPVKSETDDANDEDDKQENEYDMDVADDAPRKDEKFQNVSSAGQMNRRVAQHESDYEEIGPPKFRNGAAPSPATTASITQCDLCGNPNPLVMCRECMEQNFCAACDEMYHKHPKRACHVRKPLSRIADKGYSYPKVEMPGTGPVAPPRSSRKRGGVASAEPSPAPSRTATLPRKPSSTSSVANPMAGRPLPPPPPVGSKAQASTPPISARTPPPALPKKSASVAQMTGMLGTKSGSPSRHPNQRTQPGIPMPAGHKVPQLPGQREQNGQWNGQQPGFNSQNRYPAQQSSQYPPYPSSSNQYPSNTGQYPQTSQYPSNPQYPVINTATMQYPAGGQYPRAAQYPPNETEDWNSPGSRGHSKYLDEVRFPPKESSIEPTSTTLNRRSSQNSRNSGRGRFSNRVNRSSSLHDLARARMDPNISDHSDGVKWKDEQSTPNINMPGPGMNGRTTSTKSLHVMPGDSMMWNNNTMWRNGLGFGMQGQQPFHPMMSGWGPVPGMMGQMPVGPNSLRGSMHELNKNFLRPSSPSGSQKSSRSKNSNRSKKSNKSNTSTRRSKSNRNKERSRTNSSSQSRNASRSSKKQRDRSNSSENDDSEDFFTGESDEEFVSISSNSDKAPRVSWTCEHCTYVNNPGIKVCAMCCKTSKNSREVMNGTQKNKESSEHGKNSLKRDKNKSNSKSKKNFISSEDDSDNNNRKSKGKSKKDYSSDGDSDDEKRRTRNKRADSRELKKASKSKSYKQTSRPRSDESDIDDDAVAAYYAVRIDKNKGMTVTQQTGSDIGRNDSSSESASAQNPMKRPNMDAPAPAKGILKKVASNPSLAKLDGMSEVSGVISEVGYITNKLTQRLKARGQHDVLDSPDIKRRTDTSSDDIWQHEKENWLRQKEELKAWAKAQGQGQGSESAHPSPKVQPAVASRDQDYMSDIPSSAGRMYRTMSGYSLADAEALLPAQARRGSEQVGPIGGKRSFRSKRFSRNLEREPALKRAQSFHMDQREDGDIWLDSQRRTFQRATSKNSVNSEHFGARSDSSDNEEPVHFTSTVTSTTRGPGGVGSYLARQEFGSSEVQPGPDSGYVSHSSGGGYPKLLVQPSQNSIKSFTMSMDRGFHGGPAKPAGPLNPSLEFNRFRSMDDLGGSKDPKNAGFELVRLLREAEKSGFTSEDVQVAVNHCGEINPITWLTENWGNMIDTVMTLASNVGHEAEENTIGTISKSEAKDALRTHKGNIWAAVTECVEGRQKKYDELFSKGNFAREDIVTMLTAHEGNVDPAFQELNKAQLKPFLMRIWGQAEPVDVASGAASTNDDTSTIAADAEDAEAFEDAPENADEGTGAAADYLPGNIIKNIEIPTKSEATQPANPEQLKFERQVRRFLAEGKVKSYEEGELVVKLIEQEYPEDEVFLVIKETKDVDQAVLLLRQDCELCANVMTIKDVIKMTHCEHSCCKDCATNFFSLVVTDQNISQAVCPFCREPSNLVDDDEVALDYYAKLDQILKDILDKDTHDLFQRKLRDRTLMKDPNFKWCYKCPFGFLADPKNKKLVCPDCRAMSCAKCLVPWEAQHDGISCQDFARWKEENNPDRQAAGLEEHLAEHGISCPACNFRYTLTKGGCMHFTCSQCKFEFCIGCNRPFKMGTKCGKDPGCAKLGLHAHHPRNCLFYLRDKEPADLQKLLKANNVEYLTEAKDVADTKKCRVQVQKETDDGMVDGVCDEVSPNGFAGYCKIHYIEYLCGLVIKEKLEVVSLMELGEVKAVFTRAGKFIPRQRPGEYEFKYLKRLAQMVEEEVPLDTA